MQRRTNFFIKHKIAAGFFASLAAGIFLSSQPVLAVGTSSAASGLTGTIRTVQEKEEQTQAGSGTAQNQTGDSQKTGSWVQRPMTALEASEEASDSARSMSEEVSVMPKYLRMVRVFDGTGENLLREDIYDLRGRVYQSITYGNLTAQLSCYDYDADGHPKGGSYMAMDFGGNDAYWYDWSCTGEKPGNGTIVYKGVSDSLGSVYTWWYNTDGTLARTMDYDPTGSSGILTEDEYEYSSAGVLQRAVSNQIDKEDPELYVSTEYLYDAYGNSKECNRKDTSDGSKEHLDLSHYVRRAKDHSWRETMTVADDGRQQTETTEHYDYDDQGDLTREIHFSGENATRISRYEYLSNEEYETVWQHGGYDTTALNEQQGMELLRDRIQQFSIPKKSVPSVGALIEALGGTPLFGSAEDHQSGVITEAYEKNGIFFYVEQVPASFFEKNYPGKMDEVKKAAGGNGTAGSDNLSGRVVYYGDADSMELYGAELWLDSGTGSEKIDTWSRRS